MKAQQRQRMIFISLGLLLVSLLTKGQSIDQEVSAQEGDQPFKAASYMGPNRTVNVMVVVHQIQGVTVTVKNTDDTVLHELQLRKAPKAYHLKLNFESSQSGQYKLELSDGRKTVVHRIEVVDIPAIESQRYITFTAASAL